MSKLYYDITVEECVVDKDEIIIDEIKKDLPHHKIIKDYLPKEWDKCEIHTAFYGILQDKIESTKMTVSLRDGKTVARITITFKDGIRLNEKLRSETFSQLDGQMSDGFGESYDKSTIPGVDRKYRIWF